jgi:hypothetical protein
MVKSLLIIGLLGSLAASAIQTFELIPVPLSLAIFGSSLFLLSYAIGRRGKPSNLTPAENGNERRSSLLKIPSSVGLHGVYSNPEETAQRAASD